MSGSFKRRHSKWDHKDSEDLTENYNDKAQTRRPREPVSPSRGSQRRDSRSKETMMAWDREGNNARTSTGPDELRRHHSRSPRNGWGRLHSRSRSRSRSRSPSHYLRREPVANERSRSRSGVSAQLCKEFVAGRCRRGSSCHFLHQDAQPYDSQPDDWENRPRRVGGSRYSPGDTNDYPPRVEKNMRICSEFLKGTCRRGTSCRYEHHDPVSEALKDDIVNDVHRNRDVFHKSRDVYPHRNHDGEPEDVYDKGPADDILRGRGRDGDRDNVHRSRDPYSHRNNDREPADVFEKGPIDVFHRDRDNSHRNRDTYSHRNHDREHADVFEKRPVNDVHRDRDRDTALKSRDTYTYRNHDHESADMFEKTPVDDVHRDRDSRHRSRDTYQNHDREPIDVFVKGPVDDAYRDRDDGHRVRDAYRNHDREPHKRGAPLCKFFASGNCKNGNRCRFVHEVRERLSPEKRSVDDKWGSDNKVQSNHQDWDGPSWTEVATMQNDMPLRGWGDKKNEIVEVNAAKSGDNSRSHEMLNMKETWVTPVANDEVHMQDEKPSQQWETGNNVPSIGLSATKGVEYASGDMEISPRDIKQPGLSSSNSHAPSLSNVGGAFYEKPYSDEFQEQKPYNDPFPTQSPDHKKKPYNDPFPMQSNPTHEEEKPYNDPFPMQSNPTHEEEKPYTDPFPIQSQPSHMENPNVYLGEGTNVIRENHHPSHEEKPNVYHLEGKNVIGNNHDSCIIPISTMNIPPHFQNPTINAPLQQGFLQTVGVQPSSDAGPIAAHFQSQTMNVTPQQGFFTSDQTNSVQHSSGLSSAAQGQPQLHSETSFVNVAATDGPHPVNATPSVTVSNDPLAKLLENRNLSVSLAQLLENSKQFPQLSISPGMPPVYGSTMQTNQVPEIPQQQYDPISDGVESNVHDSSYQRLNEKRVPDDEDGNMKQQEPVTESKDDEKVKGIAEGSMKDPETRPSEDAPIDEGDDANKSKDTKAIRPFKFALTEFVKDLLKPSWKDGHVSKDAYKTIVKKVVDKIIEAQGPQIPQTKEKIDHYLSCSKPKIEKLVQAYVGKFQKP